jgi:hypothetical protein
MYSGYIGIPTDNEREHQRRFSQPNGHASTHARSDRSTLKLIHGATNYPGPMVLHTNTPDILVNLMPFNHTKRVRTMAES